MDDFSLSLDMGLINIHDINFFGHFDDTNIASGVVTEPPSMQ